MNKLIGPLPGCEKAAHDAQVALVPLGRIQAEQHDGDTRIGQGLERRVQLSSAREHDAGLQSGDFGDGPSGCEEGFLSESRNQPVQQGKGRSGRFLHADQAFAARGEGGQKMGDGGAERQKGSGSGVETQGPAGRVGNQDFLVGFRERERFGQSGLSLGPLRSEVQEDGQSPGRHDDDPASFVHLVIIA